MGKKVLFIEDEQILVETLKKRLEKKGVKLLSAKNGRVGFDIAEKEKPDLILLDILMPVMGGVETLEKIRQCEWGKDTCVIVLTNLSSKDTERDIENLGAKKYLIKADIDLNKVEEIILDQLK